MKDGLPISCMCLTYGRPHLLEEAVESFLRQDYKGKKELIVLNDLPDQKLIFDHPEVSIINVSKRFRGMGEKRNACAALCTHDLLFVWDDDDIFLPWRLSYCVEKLRENRRFFKPAQSYMLNAGKMSGPHANVFHSSACWERSLFNEVNGYPHHQGTGEDIAIEAKFQSALGDVPLSEVLPVEMNFYIYRWDGTNSYHLSGFGNGSDYRMVADFVVQQRSSGGAPSGRFRLKPHWKVDYVAAVANYLQQGSSTPPQTICASHYDSSVLKPRRAPLKQSKAFLTKLRRRAAIADWLLHCADPLGSKMDPPAIQLSAMK